jgi:hypothetical protein
MVTIIVHEESDEKVWMVIFGGERGGVEGRKKICPRLWN